MEEEEGQEEEGRVKERGRERSRSRRAVAYSVGLYIDWIMDITLCVVRSCHISHAHTMQPLVLPVHLPIGQPPPAPAEPQRAQSGPVARTVQPPPQGPGSSGPLAVHGLHPPGLARGHEHATLTPNHCIRTPYVHSTN